MTADTQSFFGNRAVILLNIADAAVSSAFVLVAKDIKIEPAFEYSPLYGTGSTLRQDIARHTADMKVSFTVHKIEVATTLNPVFKILSSSGSTAGTLTAANGDTTATQLFDVDIYLDADAAAADNIKYAITDVYFESFPASMSDTDWVGFEFTGHGTAMAITNTNGPDYSAE